MLKVNAVFMAGKGPFLPLIKLPLPFTNDQFVHIRRFKILKRPLGNLMLNQCYCLCALPLFLGVAAVFCYFYC